MKGMHTEPADFRAAKGETYGGDPERRCGICGNWSGAGVALGLGFGEWRWIGRECARAITNLVLAKDAPMIMECTELGLEDVLRAEEDDRHVIPEIGKRAFKAVWRDGLDG